MAADVADWTQAVNVIGGTVSITGPVTATISGVVTVSVSGTPNVAISGVPAVTINSGSVTATISGTPNVNISSSSVTLNVAITGTPAVSISGTPNVTIASGTVAISGTPNINISAQSITVGVALPWVACGAGATLITDLASSFTTTAVQVGAQTLGISTSNLGTSLLGLQVKGHQSGLSYEQGASGQRFGQWITIPINAALDSTYDISWASSATGGISAVVGAYSSALAMGYPALGQNPAAESIPVVLPIDQSELPVRARTQVEQVANSAPATGTQATCSFAASTGGIWVVDAYSGSVVATIAASGIHDLILSDAFIGTLVQISCAVPAVLGTAFAVTDRGRAIQGTLNNTMTCKMNAAGANILQRTNMGAYLKAIP